MLIFTVHVSASTKIVLNFPQTVHVTDVNTLFPPIEFTNVKAAGHQNTIKKFLAANSILNSINISSLASSYKLSTGGSVVEFSPATREARVRFPASATEIFFLR